MNLPARQTRSQEPRIPARFAGNRRPGGGGYAATMSHPTHPSVSCFVALVLTVGCGRDAAAAPEDLHVAAPDRIRRMQSDAELAGRAWWGYWGDQPQQYVSHSSHSNRLIPVYTFGMSLASVSGTNSVYRDAAKLTALYGRQPDRTLNPDAEYFDQTDVYRLQLAAADAGKKHIVLVIFDGMDWHTTRTAAIAARGAVEYTEGRGTGFAFQDYRGALTDFGFCVTSPANDKTKSDVDAQAVKNPGGELAGGYDATRGGATPWARRTSLTYLIGKDRDVPHPYTDSAASAASFCSGIKTYNDAINVDVNGRHVESIARTLQTRGYAVGAVSSVPASHATPACRTWATPPCAWWPPMRASTSRGARTWPARRTRASPGQSRPTARRSMATSHSRCPPGRSTPTPWWWATRWPRWPRARCAMRCGRPRRCGACPPRPTSPGPRPAGRPVRRRGRAPTSHPSRRCCGRR